MKTLVDESTSASDILAPQRREILWLWSDPAQVLEVDLADWQAPAVEMRHGRDRIGGATGLEAWRPGEDGVDLEYCSRYPSLLVPVQRAQRRSRPVTSSHSNRRELEAPRFDARSRAARICFACRTHGVSGVSRRKYRFTQRTTDTVSRTVAEGCATKATAGRAARGERGTRPCRHQLQTFSKTVAPTRLLAQIYAAPRLRTTNSNCHQVHVVRRRTIPASLLRPSNS